jgi:hypothetical protein
MIALVDTSFLFALANPRDANHEACLETARQIEDRLVIPAMVLPEIAYLLDSRLGHGAMRRFVRQIAQPDWTLEMVTQDDMLRVRELLSQYADNRLDFVDATIVTVAERLNVRRILTLDRRHFRVIRPLHTSAFELLPQ